MASRARSDVCGRVRTASLVQAAVCMAGMALALSPTSVHAQASLASEDRIDNIPVEALGTSFTVMRDAWLEDQWYYMPDMPRLFERRVGDRTAPEFALYRYQLDDPDNPVGLLEGGILQFAVSLDVPEVAQEVMRARISDHTGVEPHEIRLAALPLESAQVHLWAPGGDRLVVDSAGDGLAPTIASQKMVFSLDLTRAGSDVLDAVVSGNTGIPIAVEMVYQGLTPPAGFRVTMDWDQIYRHFSSDSRLRHEAAAMWWELEGQVDHEYVYNTLTQERALVVEIIDGGDDFDISQYLTPILDRINKELLESVKPPEQVDPAALAESEGEGSGRGRPWLWRLMGLRSSTELDVAMKGAHDRKTGSETVDFSRRQIVERRTQASGFIGIGHYPEEMREKLVTVVPRFGWTQAYFLLPTTLFRPNLNVTSADMEIKLVRGSGARRTVLETRAFQWRQAEEAWYAGGEPRFAAVFPLMGFEDALDDLYFETRLYALQNYTDAVEVIEQTPVFSRDAGRREIPIQSAALFDIIGFDGTTLPMFDWRTADNPEGRLLAVSIQLHTDGHTRSATLLPSRRGGALPDPVYFLVPSEGSLRADVTFTLREDGRIVRVPWEHSGVDLRRTDIGQALDLILLDIDAF